MLGLESVKPRFRIVFPIVFSVVSGVLLLGCFLHLGHSVWCQYFLESMFPSGLIGRVLLHLLVRSSIVQQGSTVWMLLEEILLVPVAFVLTIAQYYLIGLLIDRFLSHGAARGHTPPL